MLHVITEGDESMATPATGIIKNKEWIIIVHLVEDLWMKRRLKRESKKLREMLKTLPPQCRSSYVKLMDLHTSTSTLKNQLTTYKAKY